MLTWIRQYAATHLFYIILIAGGGIAFHSWLAEHDARQAAQAKVADLQTQIAAVSAQAAQKVQVVTKVIHDLGPTPPPIQVVAAVPQLTDVPLNTRVVPDNSVDVQVAAEPLVQVLAQAKEDSINFKACQGVSTLKDQQIQALKKKPSFWHRAAGTAKAVGVGIGIGVVIAILK